MKQETFGKIEQFMLESMKDSAHDREHIYRVLYLALDIAEHEQGVNKDILVISCLLHDIGRERQYRDPSVCHARAGSEMAYRYLIDNGFSMEDALHVRACISSHRYRSEDPPASIEARILYDADKLDATGAMGIARTLLYQGQESEPLYSTDAGGGVLDGSMDAEPSFFREYHYKLKKLYGNFHTEHGGRLAEERRKAAASFYENLLNEVKAAHVRGNEILSAFLEPI